MAFEDRTDKELKARKNKAWRKFWSLKGIFQKSEFKIEGKSAG